MRPFRLPAIALLALWLAGCASLPDGFEQTPSHTWDAPESTALGAFFARQAPERPGVSGVHLLSDPNQAFLARYSLAGSAEQTLDMQYYLWKGDLTGELLLYQALLAADRGVRVRILIDDIYHAGRDAVYAAIDTHPHVQVRVFNPIGNRGIGRNLNYVFHRGRLNHRMHNKIFLVDNAVAVLGGRNIGDDYFGIDPALNFHDLDVLTVGAAAQDAGAAYDLYWNSRHAVPVAVLVSEAADATDLDRLRLDLETSLANTLGAIPYDVPLPHEVRAEDLESVARAMDWVDTEVVIDSLDRFEGGNESAFVELSRRLAGQIDHEVLVQTAYLIPTEEGIDMIRQLTARGVRFRLLTNSMASNNHLSVHAHYMKHRKALLEAGVELYELKPETALLEYLKNQEERVAYSHSGLHAKAFVVDGETTLIGSYNMDPRSRIWNSEIGLLIHSEAFGAKVREEMLEEFESGTSYRLSLNDRGKVIWTLDTPQGQTVFTKDPNTSAWRRFLARMIGWLPIGNEL